jgi:hypothetical protein
VAIFTPYTDVLYESAGSWPVLAQSWPDDGLQGAGIAVAAQDETTGTLPPGSPLTLDRPFTSAINTGEPDSICTGEPASASGGQTPPGLRTSHPAFPGAPAYYEVGPSSGRYAGQAPRGVMLVIHGMGAASCTTSAPRRSARRTWRATIPWRTPPPR